MVTDIAILQLFFFFAYAFSAANAEGRLAMTAEMVNDMAILQIFFFACFLIQGCLYIITTIINVRFEAIHFLSAHVRATFASHMTDQTRFTSLPFL